MRVIVALLLTSCLLSLAQPPQEEGRWAFVPARDDFSPGALLDLRGMNEAEAGQSGFVRTGVSGNFVLGNGQPVRFWAVNTTVAREQPFVPRPLWAQIPPDLAHHARFLAKRGVNMVRLHAFLNPDTKAGKITDINKSDRDWIWRTVAAMKKEGIYTTVSPYWANNMKFAAAWGQATDLDAHALLFFDETMQDAYRAWLRALLAETNPYTGIPLAEDPALAIIHLQNEDSLLFWTVNNLKGDYSAALGKKFGTWVQAKYGSIDTGLKAWAGNSVKGDDPASGVLEFHNIWEMTQVRTGGFAARLADQLQFWTETMMMFNRDTERFLREDLGCGQLVNPGNWKSADPLRLEDIERYSYTTEQILAVNRYFTGVHKGPNATWAVVNNDEFTSPSALTNPRDFPLNLKQVPGFPMMVTESLWVMPMAYATEAPLLIAAYQSLTDIDAYFWFSTGDEEWTHPQSANGYLRSQAKWMFGSPDMLGTFPAAVLLYRMGYLREGDPVVVEERSLADMWARRTPIIAESASFDPNRDAGDIARQSGVQTGVDPLAFLVGPVHVVPNGDPAQTRTTGLGEFILDGGKRIGAITGEIELDIEKGVFRINSAKAQGVAAFFRNQPQVVLGDVTLQSGNDCGSVFVVAMDDRPLGESGKVLVQVGTRSRPTGWQDEPREITLTNNQKVDGFRVINFGRAPWQVVRADLAVRVRTTSLAKAVILDVNGNPAGEIQLERTDTDVSFRFPEEAMYVVLTR